MSDVGPRPGSGVLPRPCPRSGSSLSPLPGFLSQISTRVFSWDYQVSGEKYSIVMMTSYCTYISNVRNRPHHLKWRHHFHNIILIEILIYQIKSINIFVHCPGHVSGVSSPQSLLFQSL